MTEPDNTILDHLRRLDEKLDRVIEDLRKLREARVAVEKSDPPSYPANSADGQMSAEVSPTYNLLLDAKGLNCPLPAIKASKIIKDVPVGGTLEVLATDSGSIPDFEGFCKQTGQLVESGCKGDVYPGHQTPAGGRVRQPRRLSAPWRIQRRGWPRDIVPSLCNGICRRNDASSHVGRCAWPRPRSSGACSIIIFEESGRQRRSLRRHVATCRLAFCLRRKPPSEM